MKSILKYSLIGLASTFLVTGCSFKTSNQIATFDLNKVNMTEITKMKTGEACQSWFLIFPTELDSTTRKAAQKAGIAHIEYQEYSNTNYLIGGSRCVTVFGR